MKIINDYDLIDIIDLATNGYKLPRAIKYSLKINVPIYIIISLFLQTFNETPINEKIRRALIDSMSIGLPFFILLNYFFNTILTEDLSLKDKSILKLQLLALQLSKNDIKTDYEMLMESKVRQTDYKVNFNENKFPAIIQNKYILIPTYDNGKIKDTSILQEHKLFSKEYIISLGEPEQKKVLKLAHT